MGSDWEGGIHGYSSFAATAVAATTTTLTTR